MRTFMADSSAGSSWARLGQYAKASLVFATTTATYFFAKATGLLPVWFQGETPAETAVIAPEAMAIALKEEDAIRINPDTAHIPTEDFSVHDLSLTDFETINLDLIKIEDAAEGQNTHEQYLIDAEFTRLSRRLLSADIATWPIEDQVIDIGQSYSFSLNEVFSGDFILLKATETDKTILPSWLSLQYQAVGSYLTGTAQAFAVAVTDSTAFVATSDGLLILDISTISHPVLLSTYPPVGTAVYARDVAVSSNTVFVANYGQELLILDVTDKNTPVLLSRYNGAVVSITISGHTAYVADYHVGLAILDVSNTSSPLLLTTYPAVRGIYGFICGSVVADNTAFLGDFYGGVIILDVSVPNSPQLRGNYSISNFHSDGVCPQFLSLSDHIAFVANMGGGLLSVDISNFSNPVLLGTYGGSAVGLEIVQAVATSGDIAFIAGANAGLFVLNISDTKSPVLLGTYPAGTSSASDLEIIDSTVYIAGHTSLEVVKLNKGNLVGVPPLSAVSQSYSITVSACDITSVLNASIYQLTLDQLPRQVQSTLLDQSLFPETTLSLHLSSTLLFADPGNSFLQLSLQITSGVPVPFWLRLELNPALLSAYPGNYQGVAFSGETAFVAGSGSLFIFDISVPSNPNLLSTFLGGDKLAVLNNTVFVVNFQVLKIIDVTVLTSPQLLSIYPANSTGAAAYDVVVGDNRVYLADYFAGLQILDVSNLTKPTLLGTYPNFGAGQAYGLTFSMNTIYLADFIGGLLILDVSVPTNPRQIGYYPASEAYGVAIVDSAVFVANKQSVLSLDASKNPVTLLSTYPAGADLVLDITALGNTVFAANGAAGLLVIDVSNTSSPQFLGNYPASSCNGVAISNNNAFVATYTAFQILDLTQWSLTATPGNMDVGNYDIRLTATDILRGSASDTFILRVEGPPQIHDVIPTQYAKVNQAFNYFIPQGLITDPNFDPLIFNATLSGGQSLPSWLQFNSISATFAGTPQSADIGNYTVLLSVTDNIAGKVNTTFNLQINDVPVVAQAIPTQLANIGLPYQWILPANTFSNPNSGELIYLAQQSNGLALPSWLHFNATLGEFTGFAQSSDAGRYGLMVVAIDRYEGQATVVFTLLVEYLPSVNQLIASPFAGIEAPFIYSIPANAFTDTNGNTLTYSATRENGASLPNWLSFNPQTLVFSGTPLPTDAGVVSIRLTAANPSGGQAQQHFNVTVTYFPQVAVPIPTQLTDVDSYDILTLSINTFIDEDNPMLIYSAQWSGHVDLPAWLQFNATLLQFVAMPTRADVGQYQLTVNATDTYGAATAAALTWMVDSFPRLNQPLAQQLTGVGLAYTFTIPANTFIDADEDLLTYQVQSASGSALPNWLSFNPQTLVLAGVPQVTDLGDLWLQVSATDPAGGRGQQNFNLSVIYFPLVATSIPAQLADIGEWYQFIVPANTFQYVDGTQSLIYSARQSGGMSLPDWLQFSSTALQFYGTVNVSSAGSLLLEVVAATAQGGQASAPFSLRVEHFPRVNSFLSVQLTGVDDPWTWVVPGNTFSDADGDLLIYQASQTDGALLPNWLSFNSASFTFSGVPRVTDLGGLSLRLRATDPDGAWVEQDFNVTVVYFPQLLQPIPDQLAGVDLFYQFTLPSDTFQNPDEQVLLYSASQQSGADLPAWLNFDTGVLRFSGVPNGTALGNYPLKVIAANPQGAVATAEFILQVEHFPRLERAIDDQWAGVGLAFSFTLPADTFIDEEDSLLTYQACLVDRSPLPNWLSFNRQSITFFGVPLETDFGTVSLSVTAADSQSASVQTNFTVDVIHFPEVAVAIPSPPILQPGLLLTMTVPNTTFSDPDHIIQTYEATVSDGTLLPAWLQFNDSTLIFSGTPGESDVGTVDILVIAQAAHQLRTAAPFSITVSMNLPPRLVKPISDQTATVGEPFNFFVSTDTFVDPEGETLTYSAKQLGGSLLPAWLHFDKDNLNFWGTPEHDDTDTYAARIISVALTAQDEQSQARATFNINVLGSSNWVLALKISAPLISILTALLAGYRQRAICLNRVNKRRYQRLQQTVAAGEIFQHPLSTPAERIGRIEVTLWRPTNGCCRLFRSQQRGLPGNALLPSWMEYDTDTNTLQSKGMVPAGITQNLIVQVKNSGGVILEQFKLMVTARPEAEEEPSQILSASGTDDRSIALETQHGYIPAASLT